jgi:hypothetical protein
MNDILSDYLRSYFRIDVATDLPFNNPAEWGIENVISLTLHSKLSRFVNVLNHRSVDLRNRLEFKHFHELIEAPELYKIWQEWTSPIRRTDEPFQEFDRWDRVGRGFVGRMLRLIAEVFPTNRIGLGATLRKGHYDLVMLTHPTEGANVVIGMQAERAGIPTACLVMGLDNFQSGPMFMSPDLFLLWGPDQTEWLRDKHAKFRPSLQASMSAEIGSLSHDRIVNQPDGDTFKNAYPHIAEDGPVVTFATYTVQADPGQRDACVSIMDSFDAHFPNGHLIVRVRPGLDEEYWHAFAAEYPGRVTIQIPIGSLFSKWDRNIMVDRSIEESDAAVYQATLRRSSLVVTSTFSTVYVDAHATGTPAIAVGIVPEGSDDSWLIDVHNLYTQFIPHYEYIEFITNKDDLLRRVSTTLLEGQIADSQNAAKIVYAAIANIPDGKAGERAAIAMDRLRG